MTNDEHIKQAENAISNILAQLEQSISAPVIGVDISQTLIVRMGMPDEILKNVH